MLAQGQAGHQSLLQAPGRQKGYASAQEAAIGAPSHVPTVDQQASRGDALEASASLQQGTLPAALQACEAYHLAVTNGQRDVLHLEAVRVYGYAVQLQRDVAKWCLGTEGYGGVLVEHHLHQATSREGSRGPAGHLALAQDRHLGAELSDLVEFVGHKDDRQAIAGQAAEGVKEQGFLWGRDARGGLVEDDDLHTKGEQTHQFELLPLAYGETAGWNVWVEVEPQICTRSEQLLTALSSALRTPQVAPEQKVVQHAQRRNVQGVLMQHADPDGDGLGRGREAHFLAAQKNPPGVACLVARQDVHEGCFARAILSQQSVDGAALNRQGDAVIGAHGTKVFFDILEFNSHTVRGTQLK
ncbi:hypothetical protein ES703_60705 [subsurface metagenome]